MSKGHKIILVTILMIGLVSIAFGFGQTGVHNGSYEGTKSGKDLVDVDLLFLGAHPDDETGMAATFARYCRDQGFKCVAILATMGEGGGNATGPELGRSLGLIRRAEVKRFSEEVGIGAHYWLNEYDFYYTLFAEQTQEKWGEDFIKKAIRIVRLTRPEVIVSMWPGPGTHGHHQMASRVATIAFQQASNPEFASEQIEEEYIKPFQPLKLYYYPKSWWWGEGRFTISIPTDDYSQDAYMRYADLKALALSNFRSQGFDQFLNIPVKNPRPEPFLLVESRVPVNEPEQHLLEGALIPTEGSPPRINYEIAVENYKVGLGEKLGVTVSLGNNTDKTLKDLTLNLNAPEGWEVRNIGTNSFSSVKPGQQVKTQFEVRAPETSEVIGKQIKVWTNYQATSNGNRISGKNYEWVEVTPGVEVEFKPLFDIANFRNFASETDIEWLIPELLARIPVSIGRRNPVTIKVINHSTKPESGELGFELPEGIDVLGDKHFTVSAGETIEKEYYLQVDASILPKNKHSGQILGKVKTTISGQISTNEGTIFALPTLTVPKVQVSPKIDGNLEDMRSMVSKNISSKDLWSGTTDNDADSSAKFYVGYDEEALYVGVDVLDQTVVCNIKPDDVRGHWRSDSVEITIDPSGNSSNTSTTFKTGIFPCTIESFKARAERDADANQGIIEETAPGMKVVSSKTNNGYTIETRIPWSVMPSPRPEPGDLFRFNVLIYDGDVADAEPGTNINESRIGWASVLGAQQAIPYVWPLVELGIGK